MKLYNTKYMKISTIPANKPYPLTIYNSVAAISTKTVFPSSSHTLTTPSYRMLTPTPSPSTSQPFVTTDTNPARATENTVYALIVVLVVLIVGLLIGAILFTMRWVRKATSRSGVLYTKLHLFFFYKILHLCSS